MNYVCQHCGEPATYRHTDYAYYRCEDHGSQHYGDPDYEHSDSGFLIPVTGEQPNG